MKRLILILALLAGLALRLFGLSHDLADGYIYHPDTPKQINATEQFLQGKYYSHYGLSDYDGYPAFNSHLVEYIVRIVRPVVATTALLTGIVSDENWPDTMTLYWITRLLSVFLATLLIWVVYRIGVENFDARTGLLAAWFLALSPADVSCAHLETCDTTASFFAIVCVFYAMRIFRRGSQTDYMLAALFGMCAFAAKYNAGMAMVAPVVAHVLRQKRWYDVFDTESISRLVLFGATAVVALFLTIPSMFIHPVVVPQEIAAFFRHISSGKRLPDEMKEAGLCGRFLFSMHRNGPILATILSAPLALVSLLGLGHVLRWDRKMVILYSLPLVYFLLGVSLRPLSHPIYHTMMTPVLFVICAACLLQLYRLNRTGALCAALVIAISCGLLLNESAEEDFYYWHRDTRRMAEAWTRENVPRSFVPDTRRYTFELGDYGDPAAGPHGVIHVATNIRRKSPLEGLHLLKEFDLESDPLPFFRNPEIGLFAWSPGLRENFTMPVSQRAPSRTGNQIIFDGGPEFYRSEKLFNAREGRLIRRVLVTTQALDRAVLVVRNGVAPSVLDVAFGGVSHHLLLASNERRVLDIARPRAGFPCERGRFFYRLRVQGHSGAARLELATAPDEVGVALYNGGLFAGAAPELSRAAARTGNPTLAAQALIAALLGGVDLPADDRARLETMTGCFRNDWTPERVFEIFGVGADYLRALEFLTYPVSALPYVGLEKNGDLLSVAAAGAKEGSAVAVPSMLLDPGSYQLELDLQPAAAGETVVNLSMSLQRGASVPWAGGDGATLGRAVRSVTLTNPYVFQPVRIPFEVPYDVNEASILVSDKAGTPLSLAAVRVVPDPLASLNALGRVVGLLDGRLGPADQRDAIAYQPLLALGDRAAATGDVDRAVECYASAAELCPNLAAAAAKLYDLRDRLPPMLSEAAQAAMDVYARSRDVRTLHEARATFAPGVNLSGYRLSTRRMRRSDTFGINLYWGLDRADADAGSLAVWVHVINDQGEVCFQADHQLAADLTSDPQMPELRPQFFEVTVPEKARLGTYYIQVGLCSADGSKRMKLKETALKTRKDGVMLPEEIRIVL